MKNISDERNNIKKASDEADRIFVRRFTMSVILLLVCVFGFSFSTYAFFLTEISSKENVIEGASFATDVIVLDENGNTPTVKYIGGNKHVASLKANRLYTVNITPRPEMTAKTGFVIVSVDGMEETYHTAQFENTGKKSDSLCFNIAISSSRNVTFYAHWGTSVYYESKRSGYYIEDGDTIEIEFEGEELFPEPKDEEGTQTDGTTEQDDSNGNADDETDTSPKPYELSAPIAQVTVTDGDTLTGIATAHGTTAQILMAYNKIADPDVIKLGSVIYIPDSSWTPGSKAPATPPVPDDDNTSTDAPTSSVDPSTDSNPDDNADEGSGTEGTIPDDTGSDDTGSEDTGSDDTGSDDTGSDDTGSDDTGSDDTGSDDAGSDDTGSDDTGSDDTGSDDAGSDDTGSDDAGSDDTGSDDASADVTESSDSNSSENTASEDSETIIE